MDSRAAGPATVDVCNGLPPREVKHLQPCREANGQAGEPGLLPGWESVWAHHPLPHCEDAQIECLHRRRLGRRQRKTGIPGFDCFVLEAKLRLFARVPTLTEMRTHHRYASQGGVRTYCVDRTGLR